MTQAVGDIFKPLLPRVHFHSSYLPISFMANSCADCQDSESGGTLAQSWIHETWMSGYVPPCLL